MYEFKKNRTCEKKVMRFWNFFCMGPYGQKRVKLISQARKISGISFKYTSILALLLPTIYANF